MKKYSSIEIEILDAVNVVTTSLEVETENIPLFQKELTDSYQL